MFKIDTFFIIWLTWASLSCSVLGVWSALKRVEPKKFIIRLLILGAINFIFFLVVRIFYYI